ncbi:MAG: hypothetical protein L7W43_11730 [Rubripirellula sp.]|nr:hypothetical protein [Rubripirellula sp.]
MHGFLTYRTFIVLTVIATLATQAETVQAEIKIGCLRTQCPSCDCSLDAKMVDVEKSCFEVETKTICIPRVVFPWQRKKACDGCDSCDGLGCSTCINNGAQTRSIRVLKKKKYTCPECKYSWTPNSKECCDGACDAASAKTEHGTKVSTKVVSHGVLLPPLTSIHPTKVAPSKLLTTELEPVHVQTLTPLSSFTR